MKDRQVVLAAAMTADDVALWQVILAMCPGVTSSEASPVGALCRHGSWVSHVPRALRLAGLAVPGESAAPDPVLVAATGPATELEWALDELRGAGVRVAVIEYHREAHRT